MSPRTAALLADALLMVHWAVVAFNVGGLAVVWIGRRRWGWVRNFGFRAAHLATMGWVAVQTLLGAACPLTRWEAALRERAGQPHGLADGFLAYWLGRLLYWDLPPGVFAAAYLAFFGLVVWTWFRIPPRRRNAP